MLLIFECGLFYHLINLPNKTSNMKLSIFSVLGFAASSLAIPFKRETVSNSTQLAEDIAVLNYALTLEHLEYAFYRDGLATFNETFQSELIQIMNHEKTHVETLTSV